MVGDNSPNSKIPMLVINKFYVYSTNTISFQKLVINQLNQLN